MIIHIHTSVCYQSTQTIIQINRYYCLDFVYFMTQNNKCVDWLFKKVEKYKRFVLYGDVEQHKHQDIWPIYNEQIIVIVAVLVIKCMIQNQEYLLIEYFIFV